MYVRFSRLSLIVTTLLLFLTAPMPLRGVIAESSGVLAQISISQNRKSAADQLLQQGIQEYHEVRLPKALQLFQQALTIYREIGDRTGEGAALGNSGLAAMRLEQYQQAIEFFEQALTISREIGNRPGEEAALGNSGLAAMRLEQYQQAIEFFEQALTISREIGNRPGEEAALGNSGLAAMRLEQYQQAIEFFEQALTISREIGNRAGEAESLEYLGNAYFYLGQGEQASRFFDQVFTIVSEDNEKAAAIAHQRGDYVGEMTALNTLGNIYQNRGLGYWSESKQKAIGYYQKAIGYYEHVLAIAQERGDAVWEKNALNSLGDLYDEVGQSFLRSVPARYQQAIEYFEKQLAIAQLGGVGADNKGEMRALNLLGDAYEELGQLQQAIKYDEQLLVLAQSRQDLFWEATALESLGNNFYKLGRYQEAISYYERLLARDRGQRTLNSLGNAYYHLGQYQQAITHYEQVLASAQNLYESQRGTQYFDRLIFNLPRMSGIFVDEAEAYSYLQRTLIDQGKFDTALAIAERSRARLFDISPKGPTPFLDLNEIRQIAQEHNATLVEYSIIQDDSRIDNQSNIRDSQLLIWVVKPTGEVALRQVDLKQQLPKTSLIELIVSTRKSMGLAGRDPSIVAERLSADETLQYQKLQQLYRILIEPVAELLPTEPEAQIIFIPQKDLFLVPFPALQNEQGTYLVEKHAILTAPSIQMLGLTQELKKRIGERGSANIHSNEVLIVGNPTMPPAFLDALLEGYPLSLRPLPGAKQEATVIADFFNTKAITGNAATEPNIVQRMANARIIHLAAHGLINYWGYGVSLAENISLGAVVLAPTGSPEPVTEQSDMGINPRDGLLTSGEILGLQLQADLVVLSACNTGSGRITDYGVIGLSRSFIVAGVPSVIVSLWSVPDAPTASLMTEFYRNWRERKLDKAQALRQAMLTTMKSHPHPKNWAAFTLIGEAE